MKLSSSTANKRLKGINERIVSLGYRLTVEQLDRAFTHQKNGELTVAKKLAGHEEHHLAPILIALSKKYNLYGIGLSNFDKSIFYK